MKIIHLVCAARPNFMKIAPLWHALQKEDWCKAIIVHSGQHYDQNMSDNFFEDLNLPQPHISLGVGSGTHAEQTGKTMIAYEKVCFEQKPDITVVVGDVNATVACALVCAKLGIPLVHLEAGLRSFDRTMPEEINRIVTDSISTLCLTPSQDGDENLLKEGIPPERIKFVGNIMIDTLEMLRPVFSAQPLPQDLKDLDGDYAVVTLHRPSNVDSKEKLAEVVVALEKISESMNLIFPVHPRTKKQLETFNLWNKLATNEKTKLIAPLGYNQFMRLVLTASVVITDSGGIQEETSYLGISCFTLRENTERPITLLHGTNKLVTARSLVSSLVDKLSENRKLKLAIPLWDGRTAERVCRELQKLQR